MIFFLWITQYIMVSLGSGERGQSITMVTSKLLELYLANLGTDNMILVNV